MPIQAISIFTCDISPLSCLYSYWPVGEWSMSCRYWASLNLLYNWRRVPSICTMVTIFLARTFVRKSIHGCQELNSGAFRVKGTDHSVLSFTHNSLVPTPLLCTRTNSTVNHTTHGHFLSLSARWLALLHCTTFTLNDCKQTGFDPGLSSM